MHALKLAQLSDTHLFADADEQLLGCTTWDAAQQAVEAVAKTAPDLIVVTGDLSQDGSPESYERIRTLLDPLGKPCYYLPGNHDHAPAMAEVLGASAANPTLSFVMGGWHFLLLDSQVPGSTWGAVPEASLAWLREQLEASPDLPAAILLHHPPLSVGARWLDPLLLHHPEALLHVVDDYPQVRLVLSGHVHQYSHQRRNAAEYYTCNSTCIQFRQKAEDFALDTRPPGFHLYTLAGDGSHACQPHEVAFSYDLDVKATGY